MIRGWDGQGRQPNRRHSRLGPGGGGEAGGTPAMSVRGRFFKAAGPLEKARLISNQCKGHHGEKHCKN